MNIEKKAVFWYNETKYTYQYFLHRMFELKKKQKKSLTEGDTGKILYSFLTPECVDHNRGNTWFLIMGGLVVFGIIIGITQDSLSLIILSVMMGAMYTITHNKKSPMITVAFTENGMQWGNRFFLYSALNSFWIFWEPGENYMLHVYKTTGFPKELLIPIENADPAQIKKFLGYYVPEIEGKKEKFSDVISRTLKL